MAKKAYVTPDAGVTWVEVASSTTDLSSYAPLASPTFTGTVTLPSTITPTKQIPYAISAGLISFATGSVVSSGNANASVTFPASRFSQTPVVVTSLQSAPGGTGNLVPRAVAASTTGFTYYVYNPGSTTQTWTATLTAGWQAIQMTTSAYSSGTAQ